MLSERTKKQPLKRSESSEKSQYIKDVNKTMESEQNFKEFKINDAGSKIEDDGFSENPSNAALSPREMKMLGISGMLLNIKLLDLPPKPKAQEKQKMAKDLKKHHNQKKKQEDNVGPREFRLGDDKDPDPTEGFESLDGSLNEEEKKKKKEDHKRMKNEHNKRVQDYKEK